MPQETVEIITQQVDALTRQDAEAFVATVSPDVEWEDAMFWSEPRRIYRGRRSRRLVSYGRRFNPGKHRRGG